MLYVIKTSNNDVIVFDSVTSFSESYQGSVTSHPVEDGSKISDHVITNNVKLKISGVVSDYNFFNPLKDFANQKVPAYNYDRKASVNTLNSVNSFEEGSSKDIPQDYFGSDSEGSFSVKASAATVKNKLISIFNNKEEVTVLEYLASGNDSVIKSYTDCVITDLSFDTNPESGYAIYPNISLEQIVKVKVEVLQADGDKISDASVANQAASGGGGGNKLPSQLKDDTQPKPESKDEKHKVPKAALDRSFEIKQCLLTWQTMASKGSTATPLCAVELGITNTTSFKAILSSIP